MTKTTKLSHKILSVFLAVALMMTVIPFAAIVSAAESNFNTVADPSTMDGWREFFMKSENEFTTENAGGIWTDKSVFTKDTANSNDLLKKLGLTTDDNGFLVALSAIGSNMTVQGQSAVATDTVFVLDTSGSMEGSAARAMVAATNTSIHTLLQANPENRIALVFYAGSATTFLPLDHYTSNNDSGTYLTINTNGSSIQLAANVKNSQNQTVTANNRSVSGGTYTARGIYQAMNILTANSNQLSQIDNPRKPVVMLMTDGVPTHADTDFTAPPSQSGNSDLGNGNSSGTAAEEIFATELTAAYAKAKITEKYGDAYKCLFYTMGMVGSESSSYAKCILDPENQNTQELIGLWDAYEAAKANDTVVVRSHIDEYWSWSQGQWVEETVIDTSVVKVETKLSEYYVDEYFDVETYQTGNTTLEEALAEAFKAVMAEIALQTAYYPTLISGGDANHSGYISFVDKVGSYMKVASVKGLILGEGLYSGADFASALNNNALGTANNPTDLGDQLVWSIQSRLGLENTTQARDIIALAYEHKQMYYNSADNYSNYFGWWSNAQGKYLGFYYEGGAQPAYTDEADKPVYINKSYLYLGVPDSTKGIAKSDMMYATVRVRTNILTGEQEVNFALPASLIPTITYAVELDAEGNLKEITANNDALGATPIRLVYETVLDERINEWTLSEIVSDSYINATGSETGNKPNVNADGSVNFYANQFDIDGKDGYGLLNPYSYFRPSYSNDRYYYQDDTDVYIKDAGDNYVLYTGAKPAANDGNVYYHGAKVYAKTGTNSYNTFTKYDRLGDEVLPAAQSKSGTWYIPAGYVRRDYADYVLNKTANNTESLDFAASPFGDYSEGLANSAEEGHYSVFGTSLGNNGRITVNSQTGIKITKALEEGATATDKEFTFSLVSSSKASKICSIYKLDANGNEIAGNQTVVFDANGTASVKLKAGETVYIGDMLNGETVIVKEIADTEYALKSLTVNGANDADGIAEITVMADKIQSADFVNGIRGEGAFTVLKVVKHPYTNYTVPAKDFSVTLSFTFNDEALKNYSFDSGYATDQNGQIALTIANGESVHITGIPEGVEVEVVENLGTDSSFFSASYIEDGTLDDGIVTIKNNITTSVEIINDYKPTKVYPVNVFVVAEKTLGREWAENDSFTFVLQKRTADGWQDMQEKSITINEGDARINTTQKIKVEFTDAFKNEEYTDIGTYAYRIIEKAGTIPGVHYDTRYHPFSVTVADENMSGKLVIKSVDYSTEYPITVEKKYNSGVDEYHVLAKFENGYNATDAAVTVEIDKNVYNPTESPYGTPDGFEFEIVQVNGGVADWANAQKFTATNINGVTKLDLTFTEVGTYTYRVREIVPNPKADGWTYFEGTVDITVEVKNDAAVGALYAKAYLSTANDNDKAKATSTVIVSITNEYKPEEAVVVIDDEPTGTVARTDFVKKILRGRALKANEFTFYIYDSTNALKATGKNLAAADGALADVIFDNNLVFDKVGTYSFTVYEKTDAAVAGVTMDESVYYVTVTVTDDQDGGLNAAVSVAGTTDNKAVFTNGYDAEDFDYSIIGKKNLENKKLTLNEFGFYIQKCDANGNALPGTVALMANNIQDGTITFPSETYTKGGTYNYLVWEIIPDGEKLGIAYDEAKYIVTVKIKDDATDAKLKLDGISYKKKAKDADAFTATDKFEFNNVYTAKAADITLNGGKQLVGMVLGGGFFEFELYDVDESDTSWQTKSHLQTVSNAAPALNDELGYFTFTKRSFDKVGEYKFIINEKIPAEPNPGISYDKTEYRITITVTDNNRGQLLTETTITTADGTPKDNVVFTNIYKVSGTDVIELSGTKILNGRDLLDEEFTFELYESNEAFTLSEGQEPAVTDKNKDSKYGFELEYYPEDVGKTFYYVIKEKNAGKNIANVSYSTTEYYVTVKVEDDLKGQIKTTATIQRGTTFVDADKLDFVNTYKLPQIPQTGDYSNIYLLFALLFVSGGGIIGIAAYDKKKKKS